MPDTQQLLDKIRKQTLGTAPSLLTNNGSAMETPISLLSPQQDKLKFEAFTPFKKESVYKDLNSGERVLMYENYIPGTDNEERLAQEQSTGDKWANGMNKFLGKTKNAVLGGTVGTVYGIFDAMKQGSFDAVYDNDMSRWLDDLNTKLDYQLPNYYTKQEKEAGFVDSLTSANFLANDLLGGLSFTTGAIISEGIWAGLTGGTSLAFSGAKWGTKALGFTKTAKALNGFKNILKAPLEGAYQAGKISKDFAIASGRLGAGTNALRFAVTSTGYEAGVEALHFKKEAEENFYEDFYKKNGRQPNSEEIAKAQEDIANASNGVFALNTAILIPSNIAMFGQNVMKGLPSPFKSITKVANRSFFGIGSEITEQGVLKVLQPTKFQKGLQKAFIYGKPAVTEGLYEEGTQSVASNFMGKWLDSQYDVESANNTFSILGAVSESLAETYGTKQGWKEIGIGMLIGSGASVLTGEGKANLKEAEQKETDFVDYSNTYQGLTLKQKGIMANQIQTAIQKAETAKQKNDKVSAHLASNEAIIAQADYKFTVNEDLNSLTKDYKTALDNMSVSDFEDIGVEKDQIQEYKDTVIEAHGSLMKRYKENRTYSDLLFSTNIKDIDSSAKSRALAFALTQGESANFLMDDILQDMSSKIGQEYVDSIQAERLLNVAGNITKNEVNRTVKDLKILKNQYDNLEKVLRKEQAKPKKVSDVKSGGTQEQQSNYFNISEQLLEVGEKVNLKKQELQDLTTRVKNEIIKRENLNGLDISSSLSSAVISSETLENLDENLGKVDNIIESYRESNPRIFNELADLTKQYQKAKENFFGYQEMAMGLSSGKLDFKGTSSWVGKKLKNQNLNEFTQDFFKSLDKYSEKLQKDYLEKRALEEIKNIQSEEVNPNKPNFKKPQEIINPKTEIEILKERINNGLKERFYPISYIGENFEELALKKPTQKDIDRYKELDKNTEEYQQIKQKLSDWRLIDSARGEDNQSFADLIDILLQLESEVEQEETLDNLDDNIELLQTEEQKALLGSVYRPDILQNLSGGAVVQRRIVEDKPTLFFSHIKASTFINKLAQNSIIAEIKTVKEKRDNIFILNKNKPLSQKLINENQSIEGTQFILGDVKLTVGAGATLAIAENDFNKIKDILNMTFFDSKTATWSFQDVYESLPDGTKVKKQSEFNTNTISEEIYNVEQGDELSLFLDFKTDWNLDLLNQSLVDLAEKGEITEETKKLIKRSIEITARKDGKNLSTFKSSRDTEIVNDIPLEIRRRYAEKFINEIESNGSLTGYPKEIDLGIKVKVKEIFMGTPELMLDNSDMPQEIAFTENAIEEILTTGYITKDSVVLADKKLEDKVTRQFVSNIVNNNSDIKVPVIVFKKGKHFIAYPISMVKEDSPQVDKLDLILNNKYVKEIDKVKQINELLISLKINPSEFELISLDAGKIENIKDKLNQYKKFTTANDLADSKYDKKNLQKEAKIKIDLEKNKISSPKITVDFQTTILPSTEVELNEMIDIRKSLTKEMQKIQREIESSSYLSDKNRFITAFDNTYIEDIDSDIMNRKNVNFLKSLYFTTNEDGTLSNKSIQGDAVKLLTRDRIEFIRKQLNRLMFLENQIKTKANEKIKKTLEC